MRPVTLNNGSLVLVNTSTTGTTFNIDTSGNLLTLAGSNDSIIAGSTTNGVAGAGGVANGAVTLAGSSMVSIPSTLTLNLGAVNGYTLAISPSLVFSNSGTITVPAGSVVLQNSNLAYSGGTLGPPTAAF